MRNSRREALHGRRARGPRARPHGERFNTLRFTPRELARGFDYDLGVLTLYVVSAADYADVIG